MPIVTAEKNWMKCAGRSCVLVTAQEVHEVVGILAFESKQGQSSEARGLSRRKGRERRGRREGKRGGKREGHGAQLQRRATKYINTMLKPSRRSAVGAWTLM